MLLIILTYLFSFGLSLKQSKENAAQQSSFTFMTSQNREYTLKKQENNFWKRNNILKRITRKILGGEDKTESISGKWYYVHFLEDDHQEFQRKLKIKTESGLLKNTYVLYLTEEELLSIENVTLVHEISPSEKFQESGGKLSDTKYFHVITTSKSNIPNISENYAIERQETEDMYIIRVDRSTETDNEYLNKKKRAIKELSEIPTVKTISTFTRFTVKNNVMTGYTQRNVPLSSFQPVDTNIYKTDKYFNNQNFRGSGQIITIQDTPIDYLHPMFYDRNSDIRSRFNQPIDDHRKFVYYGATSKWQITENEHGTHVAGTTAGNAEPVCQGYPITYYNGNAPDAKILYAGDLNDVPSTTLGSLMSAHNSYISTNSWGVNGYNDEINFEYGSLAYKNPDRLFLFAAGNEYSDGNFTVCDPGGSKNVLTVGAMGDFYKTSKYDITDGYSTLSTEGLLPADPWVVGTLGSRTDSAIVAIDLDQPTDQCSTINCGKVSLLYKAERSLPSWVGNCQLERTSGILFTTNVNAVRSLMNRQVTLKEIVVINNSAQITHADYSSGGPGNKGIQKPDIMTPGTHIYSAKSLPGRSTYPQCDITQGGLLTNMQGTSMATPNAAGATALVREYFGKTSPWNVQLDSTTLRALMINSCKHPYNSKTPDALFGHGIVDLSTILPTDGTFGVQMTPSLQIRSSRNHLAGNKPSVSEQRHVSSYIDVTPNGKPLQITLSYLDPLMDRSSVVPLTRDLDLVVITPNGIMYKGDHFDNGDTQHASTNEKVIIDNPQQGRYYVHVVGSDFADSTSGNDRQEFAVVASGPIQNGWLYFNEPTTCPCPRCMPDAPLYCQCDSATQIGYVCEANVIDVKGDKYSVTLGPLEIARLYFRTNKIVKSISSKSSQAGNGATIWVSTQCHASLSQYEVSGSTGSMMTKKTNVKFGTKDVCVAVFNNNYQRATYNIECSEKEGLGTKNTVIIVVCVVAALAAAAVVVYCCCCKNRGGGGGGGDDGGNAVYKNDLI